MCYEELTARPFWFQKERRPSQTSLAEMWLRGFLREGEKPSEEILRAGEIAGFAECNFRKALRHVGAKNKQGHGGGWSWRLKEIEPIPRETSYGIPQESWALI